MRYSEICGKQVVSITSGTLIGHVSDLGFDACQYQVQALYVQPCKPFVKRLLPWLFPTEQIEIPIREIEHIAGDVILVHVRI